MKVWMLWLREDECGWTDTKAAWRQCATLEHLLCRKQPPSRHAKRASGAPAAGPHDFRYPMMLCAPEAILLDLLPDHVFVISAINQRVDFAVAGITEQPAAFNALAEKDVR